MRNYAIRNTKWLNKGHEMDYMASLIMRPGNDIYIVGSTTEIMAFYERVGKVLDKEGVIKGIVHTESEKTISGINIPIISDEEIPNSINTIIVCAAFERGKYESLRRLFQGYGFEENKQFFQGEIFSMVYEVYALDKICIDRIEVFVTSFCPLKCEKCIAYIPYFKQYTHTPIDKLKDDADCLFSNVDYIGKYKVLGGDALSYPYLHDYIEYICNKYGEKIGSIRIGTNGTILPSNELLSLFSKYNVVMDVSDYRCSIGSRSKLEKIKELCDQHNVALDVKRTGEQWLDMGFPKKIPGLRDEAHIRDHYFMCAMFCRDFDDGKLYHCCSNFAAVKAGLFPKNENDYFDFRKSFSKKELLEYELGYCSLGHTTFCNVCRGGSDEANPFHTEVAKQVEGGLIP